MKTVATNEAPKAIGPYSQAVIAHGLVYTSGQIALMPDGTMESRGIEYQTKQVFKNLYYVLKEADSNFDHVIKTTIFLADMNDFEKVNEIYAYYFGNHKPARSTVAVKTLPKDALIEIECIAIADKSIDFG